MNKINSEIISNLPYWFEGKKEDNSFMRKFLYVFGKQLNDANSVLGYAYDQTSYKTADIDYADIMYKAMLPTDINPKEIKYIKTESLLLLLVDDVKSFLKDYEDKAYIDYEKNIVYVKKMYDKTHKDKYGKIIVGINDKEIEYPLVTHHVWNFLDEAGALFSTPRLPNENNEQYKRRIEDVFINKSNTSKFGLLNGIARELGLRKYVEWIDGSSDIKLKSKMIIANSITIDNIKVHIEDINISDDDFIVLVGNPKYKNIKREISFVSQIEMHSISNENDIELFNELYNPDGTYNEKFIRYANFIKNKYPIIWGEFNFDESVWVNEEVKENKSFIPHKMDSNINGFINFNKKELNL